MLYTQTVETPLGQVLLAGREDALTGLWFLGQAHFPTHLSAAQEQDTGVFQQTRLWLSRYFQGADPGFLPPLAPDGTVFQQAVWALLLTIPRGQTLTYGEIARRLSVRSAQAVGGAVGRNPISLLIPCHRVVGAKGALTGYAGGLSRKAALLELEQGE